MARTKQGVPTPAEIRALRFLHEHGPSTVREYLEKGEHPGGHAYTTVMSLMNVLHEKGLATRKPEGRAFRYAPVMNETELRTVSLAMVLDNVFGGAADELRATLAELEKRPKRKK